MIKQKGRVVIPADANPWPHEVQVAKILALAGYSVEFIPEANLKTPDIYLNGTMYEIKSPITNNPRDDAIQRTLKNKVKDLSGLKKLIFINKRGQIVDIIALV